MDENIVYEILSSVEESPTGHVAAYGQIAHIIGGDKTAHLVGKVLRYARH